LNGLRGGADDVEHQLGMPASSTLGVARARARTAIRGRFSSRAPSSSARTSSPLAWSNNVTLIAVRSRIVACPVASGPSRPGERSCWRASGNRSSVVPRTWRPNEPQQAGALEGREVV